MHYFTYKINPSQFKYFRQCRICKIMKKQDREELLKFYKNHQHDDDEPVQINSPISINLPKSLSVFFATLCVVDLFGVFPIVTLPKAIISCGQS